MRVFGLMIVRNEVDILRTNVLHHLALGVDHFLVVDNGSEDGTNRVLTELERTGRVAWGSDSGPYRQPEVITQLALEAFLRGADWVVPIDADEFWYAPRGNFRSVLAASHAGALCAEVVNYVQRRDQIETTPDALLTMTYRPAQPIGPLADVRSLVGSGRCAFVEAVYAPKWISRASPGLEIGTGNHSVAGTTGPLEATNEVLCLHAALRSRRLFEAQTANAQRARDAGNERNWHWIRWRELEEAGRLEREWAANSWANGCLDVHGAAHPLVEDQLLHDVVAPWIGAVLPEPVRPVEAASSRLQLRSSSSSVVAAARDAIEVVPGWFSVKEAELLIAAAVLACTRTDSPGTIVELGSYQGRSTIVLGAVARELGPDIVVCAIDPHEGELQQDGFPSTQGATFESFCRHIAGAGLESVVRVIRSRSWEVRWKQPIALLFVDALHDYESVSRDFAHYEAWLCPGGYVAFHDYDVAYPGVVRFVDELLASDRYTRYQHSGSLVVLQRVPDDSVAGASGHFQEGTSVRDLDIRLERQQTAIEILKELVRELMTSRDSDRLERDERICALQEELFEKVGQRDSAIRALQEELHQKIGEANEIIRALQQELHEKIGDRDRTILGLHAEMLEKVEARDRLIRSLQADVERLSGGT
jgi:predicted O-methyltransferase YrrM